MAIDVAQLLAARQPQPAAFTPAQSPAPVIPIAPSNANTTDAGRGGFNPNEMVQNLFTRLGVPGAVADAKARFGDSDYAGAAGAGVRALGGAALGTGITALAPIGAAEAAVAHTVGGFLGGLAGNKQAAVQQAATAAGAAPVASQAPTAAQPQATPSAAPAAAAAPAQAAPAIDPLTAAIHSMPAGKALALLGALHPYSTTAPQRDLSDINHAKFVQELMAIDPKAAGADRAKATQSALDNLYKSQGALYGQTLQNTSLYGGGFSQTP